MESQYNKSIEEVLSTLQELQTMEVHPEKGVIETSGNKSNTSEYQPPVIGRTKNLVVQKAEQDRAKRVQRNKRLNLLFSVFLGSCLTLGPIAYIVYNDERLRKSTPLPDILIPSPEQTEPTGGNFDHKRHTEDLIENAIKRAETHISVARQLILKGEIQTAREILLKVAGIEAKFSKQTFAQVALALANSFDPNILEKIENADANPDKTKAIHWYKQWHQANLESGVTTTATQLDQILNSLK